MRIRGGKKLARLVFAPSHLAMLKALRTRDSFVRFIAAITLLHIVVGIAMAAAPPIHEFIHHTLMHHHDGNDDNDDDHDCIVLVFHSGGTEQPHAEPVLAGAVLSQCFYKVAQFEPQWAEPLFLSQCVLEHAPPTLS